jgi:hypothetical protein
MAACRMCGGPTGRISRLARDDARTPPAVEYVPGDLSAASIERILARLELTQRLARKAGPPSHVRKFEPVEPLADEDGWR